MDDVRYQNAVKVAEKALEIASRHRDPRVQLIAVLNRPLAHIATTITNHVAEEVRKGNTDVADIAQGIFDDLFERARRAHAEDVVEQLFAFAAVHPHPDAKSLALLKHPAAKITVLILTEVDRHVTNGIHETERIAKAILNARLY